MSFCMLFIEKPFNLSTLYLFLQMILRFVQMVFLGLLISKIEV